MLTAEKKAEAIKESGNQHFKEGRYSAALEKFEEAIACHARCVAAWFNKGMALKKLNRPSEAIASFQQALIYDRNYQKARFQLASTQYEIGDYSSALKNINTFLSLEPEHSEAIVIRYQCYQQLQAKLFFGIVDLKWTESGRVKILEFGPGMRSGTVSHDTLYSKSIRTKLVQSLKRYDLPIYLNARLGVPGSDDSEFVAKLQKGAQWLTRAPFDFSKLDTYRGIYGGHDCVPVPEDILKMDDSLAAQLLCDDKQFMHEMILGCEQQDRSPDYRPACRVYPLRYTRTLARTIIQDMPADYYVLKKPNGSGGRGVVLVSRQTLDRELQRLLAVNERDFIKSCGERALNSLSPETDSALRSGDIQGVLSAIYESMGAVTDSSAWLMQNSGTPNFLVETYAPSRPFLMENNYFDPTLRVYFYITRDEGVVRFHPVGCAWKLPQENISSTYTRESRISSFSLQHRLSAKVDLTTQTAVYGQLQAIFPRLFEYVFKYDIHSYVSRFIQPNATREAKHYGGYVLSLLSSFYRELGESELALKMILDAKKAGLGDSKVYLEMGLIYATQQKHQKALSAFNRALSQQSYIPKTIYERAKTLVKLNRLEEARDEFGRALMLHAAPEQHILHELKKLENPDYKSEPIFVSLEGGYHWKKAKPILFSQFSSRVEVKEAERPLQIVGEYLGERDIEPKKRLSVK